MKGVVECSPAEVDSSHWQWPQTVAYHSLGCRQSKQNKRRSETLVLFSRHTSGEREREVNTRAPHAVTRTEIYFSIGRAVDELRVCSEELPATGTHLIRSVSGILQIQLKFLLECVSCFGGCGFFLRFRVSL